MGPQNIEFEIPSESPNSPEVAGSKSPERSAGSGQKHERLPTKELAQIQNSAAAQAAAQQLANDAAGQATILPIPSDDSQVPATPVRTLDENAIDILEKTYVAKAKAIISQTKSDPYVQKIEISRAKVQYLKERFNKETKNVDTSIKT